MGSKNQAACQLQCPHEVFMANRRTESTRENLGEAEKQVVTGRLRYKFGQAEA